MRAQLGQWKGSISYLILLPAVFGLWVCTAPSWAADTTAKVTAVSAKPVLVQGIDMHPDSGSFLIEVQTTGIPTFKSFELENPHRIVVDMMNAELTSKRYRFSVGQGNIKSVRLAQFSSTPGKTVRAVFLTEGKVQYSFDGSPTALKMVVGIARKTAMKEKETTEAKLPVVQAAAKASIKPMTAVDRPATVVRGVETQLLQNGLVVSIKSDGVLKYQTQQLENPDRLVVDLASVVLRSPRHRMNLNHGDLTAVRLGQLSVGDSPVVRTVVDESRKASYRIESSNEGLKLIFPAVAETASVVKPEIVAVKGTSESGPPPELTGKKDLSSKEPTIEKAKAKPEVKIAALKPPPLVVRPETLGTKTVKAPDSWMALPKKLQAPYRPVVTVKNLKELERPNFMVAQTNFDEMRPPNPVIAKKDEKPAEAAQMQSAASIAMNPPVAPPAPAVSANPASNVSAPPVTQPIAQNQPPAVVPPADRVTIQAAPVVAAQTASTTNPNDIISLDLRDVDIRDFFRLIHEVSGLNIVLDPSVRGTLTIDLKDVPWTQALDIVLQNNQLGKQLDGNVLRIVTLKSMQEEQDARRKILESQVAEEEAAARKTYTRTPSYLKAKDLAGIFTELLGIKSGTQSKDDVIFDDSTNMIIVRTTPKRMDELDQIMKVMDVKSQQVEIEARVVAANRSFLRDLGIQLGAQFFPGSGKNVIAGVPSLNSPVIRTPRPPVSSAAPPTQLGQPSSGPLPLNLDLAATAATSGFSYFYTGSNLLLDSVISAAESKGTAKLLSTPKIITQNHVQGVVEQGVQIPVQTVVNNTVSNQFIRFSLKLTVTPQITAEGTVFLDANVENSTPDFNREVNGIPTIQTQQAITRVLVNDGGTVVIGGVLIDQNQVNYKQVPGLGDVPLIGNLFKNKSVQKTSQELLFFLTPKILK